MADKNPNPVDQGVIDHAAMACQVLALKIDELIPPEMKQSSVLFAMSLVALARYHLRMAGREAGQDIVNVIATMSEDIEHAISAGILPIVESEQKQ